MGSPNFPLGVQPNPLINSLYGDGFEYPFPSEAMTILTEDGVPLLTEAGTPLLTE